MKIDTLTVKEILINSLCDSVDSDKIEKLLEEINDRAKKESFEDLELGSAASSKKKKPNEEMYKEFEEKDVPSDPDYVNKLEEHNKAESGEVDINSDDFSPVVDVGGSSSGIEGLDDLDDLEEEQEVKPKKKIAGSVAVDRSAGGDGSARVKKEFFIVLNLPEADIPADTTGWVVQADEGTRADSIVGSIKSAGDQYNNSKKGQKEPAESIGEILDMAAAKYFKEENILVKTKSPVWVVGVRP